MHHAESIREKEEEDRRAKQLAQEAYIARLNAEQLGLLGEEDRISLSEVDDTLQKRTQVEQKEDSSVMEKQPPKGSKHYLRAEHHSNWMRVATTARKLTVVMVLLAAPPVIVLGRRLCVEWFRP